MGLDVSHDCWHGAYFSFMTWRREIARLCGIPLDFMNGFQDEYLYSKLPEYIQTELPIEWENLKPDIIHVLLNHSDCEGIIESKYCELLAKRLEDLLPELEKLADNPGHIGNWKAKTQLFIDGLRLAASQKEDINFH